MIKGRTCYRINFSNENLDKTMLPDVLFINNGSYSLETEKNSENTRKYLNKYWNITSLEKPLLSISSYKLDDLKIICEKMDIPLLNNGKPKLKKDMYQDIIKKL